MSFPNPDIPRSCPICSATLKLTERGQILIDVCEDHGIWLDHGEFELLQEQGPVKELARRREKIVSQKGDGRRFTVDQASDLFGLRTRSRENLRKALEPKDAAQTRADIPLRVHNEGVVDEGFRQCALCGDVMKPTKRRDFWGGGETIIIDCCEPHGQWFDGGELEILLARSEKSRRNLSSASARRRRLERRLDSIAEMGFDDE